EVKGLEGKGGPLGAWCAAALKLHSARPDDKKTLGEVRLLLAQVAAARPSWSRVPLLEGRLYDLEGDTDKALERYRLALERGERRLWLVRRLLQLLMEERRYGEANALVQRWLPEKALAAPGL